MYTQIVKNCSVRELLPIIQGKAATDAVIYSDSFKTYDGLVNYGYKKHFRVNIVIMNLLMNTTTQPVSKTSGDSARSDLLSSEGCINIPFYLHIKNVNSGTIFETRIFTYFTQRNTK